MILRHGQSVDMGLSSDHPIWRSCPSCLSNFRQLMDTMLLDQHLSACNMMAYGKSTYVIINQWWKSA